MSSLISPIGKFAGFYKTETHWWGGYYSPLIVYPDGKVTIAGMEIVYSFDEDNNQLDFGWQVISGHIAKGSFSFDSDGTFSGSINPRHKDGPVKFTGTRKGHPLDCWTGIYNAQTGKGIDLSPLIVDPTGEVTISGDRVEYMYEPESDTLTLSNATVGEHKISGSIKFQSNGNEASFSGNITESGNQTTYSGKYTGMPLAYWAMYYDTQAKWWGGTFSPLVVHNNDTVDIARNRINFDYDPSKGHLSFGWQYIGDRESKGEITFDNDFQIDKFSGTINPRHKDGPVSFTGEGNPDTDINIENELSSDVDVYGLSKAGKFEHIATINPGDSKSYKAYQGQYFLAKTGKEVFSGYYAYPGLTNWHLKPHPTGLLPSVGSSNTMTFNLINHLSAYLELYRVEQDGTLAFHTTLPAKKQFHQVTTEHTQWVVAQQGRIIDKYTAFKKQATWIVNATGAPAYGMDIPDQGNLTASPISAYNVGKGEFTVSAMVATNKPGTVISRKSTQGGQGNGGFLLVIKEDAAIKFATDDGFGYYEVDSVPTDIFDGEHHGIAGVRSSNGELSIYVDGKEVQSTSKHNKGTPLNIDNDLDMMIGATEQEQEPHNQFTGIVMNVGFWNVALTGKQLELVMFGRIEDAKNGLCGFWSLNFDLDDNSEFHNRLQTKGNVSFTPVFHCVWAYGDHNFVFCQMDNPQNDLLPPKPNTRTQTITVPENAEVLYAGITDNSVDFRAPSGVKLVIEDPDGHKYDSDTNTDDLFVQMQGDSLFALSVVKPKAGDWKIMITSQYNRGYHFQLQVPPAKDRVETTLNTIRPLFSATRPTNALITEHFMKKNMESMSWGGWGHFIAGVAVGGATVVAGAALATVGAPAGAVVAVGVAGLGITKAIVDDYMVSLKEMDQHSAIHYSEGTGGYITGRTDLLLIDANVPQDEATQILYKRRKKRLYPYVKSSQYSDRYSSLIEKEDVPDKVGKALEAPKLSFCTASGHGKPNYLTGWAPKGEPLPETIKKGKISEEQAKDKVFHFFACHCGAKDGVGAALVSKGAKAFFGYNRAFKLKISSQVEFCDCDISIDKGLIDGKTAKEVYLNTLQVFDQKINRFKADGDYQSASILEEDRNKLVSPTTSKEYGKEDAKI